MRYAARADQCGRSRCKYFNNCFLYRARREASSARILVVNHALLLSDIVLKQENDGYDATAILPPFSRLIFDEGHHLEDVATSHLSLIISRGAIIKQMHRLVSRKTNRSGLLNILSNRLLRDLPESMETLHADLSGLLETSLFPKNLDVAQLTEQTMDWLALSVAQESKGEARERKLRLTPEVELRPFWQELRERIRTLADALCDYTSALRTLLRRCQDLPEQLREKQANQLLDIAGIEGRLRAMADGLLFMTGDPEGYCRWIETSSGHRGVQARLCAAPLDISGQVRQSILDRNKTIIVTSATLTVGGEFGYIKKRTGFNLLEKARLDELRLASPFDHASQVFAAVPDDMPDPTAPGFREALQVSITRSVTISRGGAFILFTSHELLNKVYSAMAPELTRLGLTTLKQGETGRHALLDPLPQGEPRRAVRHRFILGRGGCEG